MTELEQKALIGRIVAGETELFETLVREHQGRVYGLALRMVSEPMDAEDCAQEAFLKAFRSLAGFRFESSFSSWLYRLTSNVCLDFLRARRRRAETSLTADDDDGDELALPTGGARRKGGAARTGALSARQAAGRFAAGAAPAGALRPQL